MILEAEVINDELLEAELLAGFNSDMSIPDGYLKPDGTKEIAVNGTHNIAEYEFVEVAVPERKEEQEKIVDIVENGTVEVFPDEEKTLSGVTINVNVDVPEGYIKPEGVLKITENGEYDVTEKSGINVQVTAKPDKPFIDSSKMKYFAYMFAGENADLSLANNLDTSNGTNFQNMFQNCTELLEAPELDTSNGTNFSSMFQNCSKMTIPKNYDLSNATAAAGMYNGCHALTSSLNLNTAKVANLSNLCSTCRNLIELTVNTDSATNMQYLVCDSAKIKTVTLTDTSKCTMFYAVFTNDYELETINGNLTLLDNCNYNRAFDQCRALKNVRFNYIGLKGQSTFNVSACSNLTVESLLSILNALSDNSELDTTYTVTLGAANLAKLTDEQIAIATSKNINLA